MSIQLLDQIKNHPFPSRVPFSQLSVWEERYLRSVLHASTWSKDPSRKVGAKLVSADKVPGPDCFNGLPRGIFDTESRILDKKIKNRLTLHAELNACIFFTGDKKDATIFVTHLPCAPCASFLIQNGIKHVVTFDPMLYSGMIEDWGTDFLLTLEVLEEAKCTVLFVTSYPDDIAKYGLPNRQIGETSNSST